MADAYDVAVIGGGIVGLAHAWMAARRQLKVLLLERSPAACGASVRNFGMIWPVGQPAGELYNVALRSRELWLELGAQHVLDVKTCGSIHLAHATDELAVLEEFAALGQYQVQMLTAAETQRRSGLVNGDRLLGGLWSDTELRVDPRTTSARIAAWLRKTSQVDLHFNTHVVAADKGRVQTSDGRTWRAEKIIVCSGSDLQSLHPAVFATSGLKLCKLQMLRSTSQAQDATAPPHLASGLTLRHYNSFRGCSSLRSLQQRIAAEAPELDRYGIHVMASQFANGEVVLGDSHEYDTDISPFDRTEIDDLMLRECRKVFSLNDWTIRERWHGIYAKHPELPVFEATTAGGTEIFVGPGGAGMTMSFGLADRAWQQWT
ncbi:TIGR03364 family FAD-dependent oxidoreductase [bacterium]|nr:TIGR03364 family FAD-dependent oxidoreductase [bacterium]